MRVAEKAAFKNLSQILNKVHRIVPAIVMGMPLVMVLPMPTMTVALPVLLSIDLSIALLLLTVYALQPINFSVSPSLLPYARLSNRQSDSRRAHVSRPGV